MRELSFQIDEAMARRVAEGLLGQRALSVEALALGSTRHDYALRFSLGSFVLSMGPLERASEYAGALALRELLASRGVPVYPFVAVDLIAELSPFAAALEPRAEGEELWAAYGGLSVEQKMELGRSMADIHARVRRCGLKASGCGVASWGREGELRASWAEWLSERAEAAIRLWRGARGSDHPLAEALIQALEWCQSDLLAVEALPCLRSADERHVLVADGAIKAIMEVDDLAFGDDLSVVALTETALAGKGLDRIYTRAWLERRGMDLSSWRRFELCRAVWALTFLAENAAPGGEGQKRELNERALEEELVSALSLFHGDDELKNAPAYSRRAEREAGASGAEAESSAR